MIVLLDLEWIENNGNHLTQLSAVRTDENWNELDRLDTFARPDMSCLKDLHHMAFGGYDLKIFADGVSAEECVSGFAQWLLEDDIILVWANSNLLFFSCLWEQYMEGSLPKVISAAKKTRKIAERKNYCAQNPYSILASMGEQAPQPKHRSTNDVEAMRRVFSQLCIPLGDFVNKPSEIPAAKPKISQRERNQKLIDNSQYNYLYIKGSEIFHRRNCKVCLSAKSHTDILGSVYYDTAAKCHRPCKLCKPVPLLIDAPITDKELAYREKLESGKLNVYTKEIIHAKMLTGEVIPIRRGHILGWCHHNLHPGAVSKAIMDEHACLIKKCPFLQRNCQSPFWNAYEQQKRSEEKRKEKLREEKKRREQEQQDLFALTDQWQSYLTDMDYDMKIVRIAKNSDYDYRIFYVSDNCFADGNRYPLFLDTLKKRYPRCRINLRHIRDVDGHFVTRSEYQKRCRK